MCYEIEFCLGLALKNYSVRMGGSRKIFIFMFLTKKEVSKWKPKKTAHVRKEQNWSFRPSKNYLSHDPVLLIRGCTARYGTGYGTWFIYDIGTLSSSQEKIAFSYRNKIREITPFYAKFINFFFLFGRQIWLMSIPSYRTVSKKGKFGF